MMWEPFDRALCAITVIAFVCLLVGYNIHENMPERVSVESGAFCWIVGSFIFIILSAVILFLFLM